MEERAAAFANVFHALSDRMRRAPCLRALSSGERNIGELAAPYRISFAAASKHAKALGRAGLLRRRVEGRAHVCRIEPAALARAGAWLRSYERFWVEPLDLLDGLLRKADLATSRRLRRAVRLRR
jgi:DNA-binding transcriptional ArsR family regulator